jgi:hypothetical protein
LESNTLDDKDENYLKILNRVNSNANVTQTWIISIITAILIVFIAIGATYVRGQVLEKVLNEEISNVQTNVYSSYPSDLGKSQENADSKALVERQDNDRKGGWATFIVLAVLFIFIQLLGILFGFKWGFVGKESLIAYEDSCTFRTKQDFINYFKQEKENISKIAQQKLQLLQQKMYQNAVSTSTSGDEMKSLKNKENRTFLEYVTIQYQIKPKLDRGIESNSEIKEKAFSQNISDNPITESMNKEIINTLYCQKCGNEIQENSSFCGKCGTPIEIKPKIPTCPKCKTTYDNEVNFCSNDGMKLELV